MRISTKTITQYFMKLATQLTMRSNYKPQNSKVTTLRMSQAGVNIQHRKLTIRFSLLLFEGGSWSSSSFRLAVLRTILQESEAKLEMKNFNPSSIFVCR